jgi:hypothetical protein
MYKVMFAASKAFAIADAIVKIQQGIANAASLKFPANIAAMASVIAATASIVSNIEAVKMEFSGQRAAGGRVSMGKAYLVGERGPEPFIPAQNGTVLPNSSINSMPKVVIHNYTDATPVVAERTEGQDKFLEITIRRVKNEIGSDIRNGTGDLTKAFEGTYALRRGR